VILEGASIGIRRIDLAQMFAGRRRRVADVLPGEKSKWRTLAGFAIYLDAASFAAYWSDEDDQPDVGRCRNVGLAGR
jgi:hypothetical protein